MKYPVTPRPAGMRDRVGGDANIAGAVWLKPGDSPGVPGVAAAYGLLNGYAIDPQEKVT